MRNINVAFGGVHAVDGRDRRPVRRRGRRPRRRQRRRQVHADARRCRAPTRPTPARSSINGEPVTINEPARRQGLRHRDDLPDARPGRQHRRGRERVPGPRADDPDRARWTTRHGVRDPQGHGPPEPATSQNFKIAGEVAVRWPAPVGRHRPGGPLQRQDPDHGRAHRGPRPGRDGAGPRPRPPAEGRGDRDLPDQPRHPRRLRPVRPDQRHVPRQARRHGRQGPTSPRTRSWR